MTTYRVKCHKMPFFDNDPCVVVVDALDAEDAVMKAADQLSRRGTIVSVGGYVEGIDDATRKRLTAIFGETGATAITEVKPWPPVQADVPATPSEPTPDLYIALFRHEDDLDVFTFYFVPDDKLKYPCPIKVAEHFKIECGPGTGPTFELARAYGPRMETLTASQVGSETLGPADWSHDEEDCLDEDDPESNVPCVACGRKDLPLHTNGRCGACGPSPTTNDQTPAGIEIRLPCYGITIHLDHDPAAGDPGCGKLTSDLKDETGTAAARTFNATVDGMEALILAHACAGIDVTTPAYIEGIETAVAAIGDHHYGS